MHLVKSCPACGNKLRFPLDRGVIQVRCSCGHSFKADPDDRALYLDAKIDMEGDAGQGISVKEILSRMKTFTSGIRPPGVNLRKNLDLVIRNVYRARYWVQNYSLHPDAEKRKVLLPLIAIILSAVFIFFLILG